MLAVASDLFYLPVSPRSSVISWPNESLEIGDRNYRITVTNFRRNFIGGNNGKKRSALKRITASREKRRVTFKRPKR
jgi:hypothetical protein